MQSKYISDILLEYERKRAAADEAARDRQLEVYRKIPRIKQIDSELASMGVEIAQSVFKKGIDINALIEDKRKSSMNLKIEKAGLLTENNYSHDYMDPKYSCMDCKDMGYIGTDRCHCFKQRIIDRYYDQSNLKGILEKENFETFVFDYYSPHKFEDEVYSPRKNMEEIFAACVHFSKDFGKSSENLFFYGKSGLGKTFLSNCIAKDLLDRGKLVVYQTSSNLIDILKEAKFESTDENSQGKLDDIFECDLLIIDDLGTEYKTEFSQMELYNVINKRLLSNKKMIISTNFSLENLYQTYAERIISRIFGSFTIYKFYGEDIRLKIGQQKRRKISRR
jgi:DNA replication protein DnaC